jgi:hypothetical protein
MFSITVESCRKFSLREILMMAAMNKADNVAMSSRRVRANAAVVQRG